MLFQNNNKICEMRSEGYQCSETVFNFFSTRSNFIPKTKEIQMYALRELAKHLHEGKNSLERCYLYMIEVDAMANLWESSVMLNQKGQLLGRGCNCSNFFLLLLRSIVPILEGYCEHLNELTYRKSLQECQAHCQC